LALRRGSQLRIGKETTVVYVGIDLHRRTSHVAAFDEEGLELLSRRVRNDPEALRALFAELGGEARVALEAAFGWEWLADLLEAEGIELHLAHPRHTKAIAAARVKTDAVDVRTLAHLLRVARVEIGGRRQGQEVWARWIDGRVQGDRNSSESPASIRVHALRIRTRSWNSSRSS
jgi:transposase